MKTPSSVCKVLHLQTVQGLYANILTIDNVCSIMTNKSEPDILQRYANAQQWFLGWNAETCISYKYTDMINELRDSNYDDLDQSGRLHTHTHTRTHISSHKSNISILFKASHFRKIVDLSNVQ